MSTFSDVRKIDNTRPGVPWITVLSIAVLLTVGYWFIKGGSFRLYASLFFGLYYLTHLSWLSIIGVSVIQNILFLPLRILYERFYLDLKKFEHEIKKTKEEEQYILLNKNVREGNASVIFYIINFVFLFIAFISAGRVFLLEFYRTPIPHHYLYSFIPYPDYPLQGVVFTFPFFNIKSTMAVDWKYILYFWGGLIGILTILRLLWRFLKRFISGNKSLLQLRRGYNRIVLIVGGFIGTFIVLSTFALRHIPTSFNFFNISVDLSLQNTTFNLVTAICTFFAAIYSGFQHSSEEAREARKINIPEDIISKVRVAYLRNSIRNGILLGVSAFWVTRLMPCSHDLSVLAFEACYVLSPVTFDLLIPKSKHRA
jgi:hypothetical protein